MCKQGLKGLIRDENWNDQTFKLLLAAKLIYINNIGKITSKF